MKYPVRINGHHSSDGYPLELMRPSEVVVAASQYLKPHSRVLDMGAYTGTTGFYLAELGHSVDSVEVNEDYIRDGLIIARHIGKFATRNTFIHQDIRTFDKRAYDAAVATNVLQSLEPREARDMLGKLRGSVSTTGLNVVRAYIGDEQQQAEVPGVTLLEPGELEETYRSAGWLVLHYQEDLKPLVQGRNPHSGKEEVKINSAAEVIARKAAESGRKAGLLREAAYFRGSDPERAQHLEAEAAALDD